MSWNCKIVSQDKAELIKEVKNTVHYIPPSLQAFFEDQINQLQPIDPSSKTAYYVATDGHVYDGSGQGRFEFGYITKV